MSHRIPFIFILAGFLMIPAQLVALDLPKKFCDGAVELNSDEALSWVEKIQDSYSKLDGFSASFQQLSYLSALDASEESSGTLGFSRKGEMKWVYETPEPKIFLLKESSYWLIDSFEKQAIIEEVESLFLSDMPVSFLLGMGNLKERFDILSACKTASSVVLDLDEKRGVKAGSPEGQGVRLTLKFSQTELLPEAALIKDLAENSNEFTFEDIERKSAFDEDYFTAEIPDDYDIVDGREE